MNEKTQCKRTDNGDGSVTLCSLDRAIEQIKKCYDPAGAAIQALKGGAEIMTTFAVYELAGDADNRRDETPIDRAPLQKLSRMQTRILRHRLEVWDAMLTVAEDEYAVGVGPKPDADTFHRIARSLHCCRWDAAEECNRFWAKWILEDAVAGSTWVGRMIGDRRGIEITNAIRSGDALARAVSLAIGREVIFPHY